MTASAAGAVELPGCWRRRDLREACKLARPWAAQARWPPEAVLLFLLNWALDNRGHTFERYLPEAWPVMRALMEEWSLPMSPSPVTATALCQVRQRMGTTSLEVLRHKANQDMLERFDGICRRDGLRLWAMDGSWVNLPSEAALEEEFGRPSGGKTGGVRPLPQALFVALELVDAGWLFDYRLVGCHDAELQAGRELARQLGPGDLLMGDRLFFDSLWYSGMRARGVELLFRVTSSRWKSFCDESRARVESLRECNGGIVDCPVMLKIDTDHKGRPRGGLLPLRYIERPPQHPGQETMRLVVSLAPERLPFDGVCAMYDDRWGIETQYRFFKGQDHLPIILSRKPETVRQEVLLRVMAHNWVRSVQAEACLKVWGDDCADSPPGTAADESEMPVQYECQPGTGSAANASDARKEDASPSGKGWRKRCVARGRPVLPVDLRIAPAIAAIAGALLSMLLGVPETHDGIIQKMLACVAKAHIYEKRGRSYSRRKRNGRRKGKGKGNAKAQYQRKKQRRAQKRTRPG